MKIKTISRTEEDYVRKTTLDITKVHRNRDPILHPFEREREYTRAIVATKLDKIFAKPFIGALDGHSDGVYCMSAIRTNLVPFISGSCDGEIRVWDLATHKCVWNTFAHTGFVRGVAPDVSGYTFFSCDTKTIKQWSVQPERTFNADESVQSSSISPLTTYNVVNDSLLGIDHHWTDAQFATCGETVSIWDETRTTPIHSYKWGADSVLSVKFNPSEGYLLGSTGNDRSVCLYDLRSSAPTKKFVLPMNSNKIAWNPREPLNFSLANEDYNIYTFDMRNLSKALMIHKDHVGAVMDIAYSPTGREIVSGSYDKTIRIFNVNSGKSRECYHTKRMQRIFSVAFSADSKYVLSGSDDTNVRIWKSNASASIGINNARDERKKQYHDTLKRRFSHMPEIKRIKHDKFIPKVIKKRKSIMHIQNVSKHRKTENIIAHSTPGSVKLKPEREKVVLREYD